MEPVPGEEGSSQPSCICLPSSCREGEAQSPEHDCCIQDRLQGGKLLMFLLTPIVFVMCQLSKIKTNYISKRADSLWTVCVFIPILILNKRLSYIAFPSGENKWVSCSPLKTQSLCLPFSIRVKSKGTIGFNLLLQQVEYLELVLDSCTVPVWSLMDRSAWGEQ